MSEKEEEECLSRFQIEIRIYAINTWSCSIANSRHQRQDLSELEEKKKKSAWMQQQQQSVRVELAVHPFIYKYIYLAKAARMKKSELR